MSVKPEPHPDPNPHTATAQVQASDTAPGPPVSARSTSLTGTATATATWHGSGARCNPYNVDLVVPYDISLPGTKSRAEEVADVREGYERLMRALEGEGGLRVGSKAPPGLEGGVGERDQTERAKAQKAGKGKDEVWVFVGVGEEKMRELVDRERELDTAHNLPPHPHDVPPSPATRIRLVNALLTSPEIQHGLGITPGTGRWKRVKSIAPLHDEERDREWIKSWSLGGDWQLGLWKGLQSEATDIGANRTPPVHLYFDFLTTYTLSLLPLASIGVLFFLLSPADSYPPLFALCLCLYSTIFVAVWRIRERRLAVRWGTKGCESLAVGRLRPEFVANLGMDSRADARRGLHSGSELAVDVAHSGNAMKRDVKVALSVPVIAVCGAVLGVVLMGIFVLEAFVAEIYDGWGKEVVPLIPTALFSLVVPQIVGFYSYLAKRLVHWEDHPTPGAAEKSLTAKTFAMNGIVAYLGLFLTAYVYVPFGPFIMATVQSYLVRFSGGEVQLAESAEKSGLGPRTSAAKQHAVKAGRLKGQLFAYTVTNQVINAFLELGLPYILRFVDDWRAGKATLKDAIKRPGLGETSESEPQTEQEVQRRFLRKVEHELSLPEYSLFTDYAEMVTQFGYLVVWSCVWPIAPLFAFLNNYFEIRGDVLKVTQHVRRPVGDRVETIGSWLDTLSILSWIGAVTSSTLIYLFRPSTHLEAQTPNPHVPPTGSVHLHHIVAAYSDSPALRTVVPTLLPLAAVALAASHAHIVLRWVVENAAERLLWRGSKEEAEVQKMRARGGATRGKGGVEGVKSEKEDGAAGVGVRKYSEEGLRGGFWNGGEEGAREIGRVGKME